MRIFATVYQIKKMDIGETKYFTSREEWRKWLQNNFSSEKELWLIFPNKQTEKPCLVYNDAVEEALCFGWIDGIGKNLDEGHRVQRFTPRKNKNYYSQANKERIKWLWKKDLIHPSIKNELEKVVNEVFVFPEDIINRIKQDELSWGNYQNFSESYKRIRIGYIAAARNRPQEFEKRLSNFLNKTRKNKQFGYGGIEKHY
jgi:uncharacterized protein YdeI (YjbR/CyaY-like superfamily)